MKFIPLILILLIAIMSCSESKKAPSLTLDEKKIEFAKYELTDQSEKILLLSTIKKISYDSLSNILLDYYTTTSYYSDTDSLKFYSEKALNEVSTKYKVQKARVANLVFCFKYEMTSKEEIFDKEAEKQVYEQELPEDPY